VRDESLGPETTQVGDIVAGDYRTAAVFEKHGIDFCCGGAVTLAAACVAHGVDPCVLLRELEAATRTPARQAADYGNWTLTRLIDHVKAIHHAYVRANVAQTAAYARKIADVHGGQHPELAEIVAAFDQMATGLMAHLEQEEEVVFPAVKRAEAAGRNGSTPEAADAETIARGIEALVREHEQVGAALHHIRDLAMGYGLPPDACATYSLTYERLQAFEADLHKHVHLENNILFPRAGDRFVPMA
jgi:regulator of cell morphogenesis and NO signaling